MGLFDSLKSAGRAATDSIQRTASEVEDMKDRMNYYSDSQLFSALKSGPYAQKSAASILLQERGYSQSEIAAAMKR